LTRILGKSNLILEVLDQVEKGGFSDFGDLRVLVFLLRDLLFRISVS